jgi:LysR family positive regulator for ilvC
MIPHISTEVSGNEALIAMVRLGTGAGIVPRLALERSPFRGEVKVVSHAPELEPYVVGLCSSKRNLKRPAVNAMWTLALSLPSTV